MCKRWPTNLFATGLAMLACVPFANTARAAGTRHYVLNAGSSISVVCNTCNPASKTSEPLTGSFDLTPLPVSASLDVAAITNVNIASPAFSAKGNGFVQRRGGDRLAMVLDAHVNGNPVLFTSGR